MRMWLQVRVHAQEVGLVVREEVLILKACSLCSGVHVWTNCEEASLLLHICVSAVMDAFQASFYSAPSFKWSILGSQYHQLSCSFGPASFIFNNAGCHSALFYIDGV